MKDHPGSCLLRTVLLIVIFLSLSQKIYPQCPG